MQSVLIATKIIYILYSNNCITVTKLYSMPVVQGVIKKDNCGMNVLQTK